MFASHSQVIYGLLGQGTGRLNVEELSSAFQEHEATGKTFADVVIDMALIERSDLLNQIALHLGWEYLEEPGDRVRPELVALLSPEQARNYGVIPVKAESQSISLLAIDPFNQQVVDDLAFALGKEVRLVVTDPEKVEALIVRYYGEDTTSLEDLLSEISPEGYVTDPEEISETDIEAMAEQAPIIRFVNLVLVQAVKDHASDIHFEPFEKEFKIRYRIDGALYEMTPPPKELALPIASRIKVLANLNIAERRIAQDGRIKITLGGRAVDLRVSTLPTQFGESVVLRVLDQSAVQLDLDQLGLPDDIAKGISEIVRRPNGIFVVTGPTGSGKTTTLYSGLREINTPEVKILTAEDPVEYEIDGIMQVPVRSEIGLTFAAALRSFLRQDPDVIMVGEIRDRETAQVSIQASLTGHLVLSTLHTNDAPGAITRLIDMGVEPFLISSTLEAVLAQRLVRRICLQCRTAYQPSDELLQRAGIERRSVGERSFYHGTGCDHCHQTGYHGRRGIFEWLRMTDSIRELVLERAPTLELRQAAITLGMRTLREDGMRAVLDGETTVEEILKYT